MGWFAPEDGGDQKTEVGQVIVCADLDTYKKLVAQLGGLPLNPLAAVSSAR